MTSNGIEFDDGRLHASGIELMAPLRLFARLDSATSLTVTFGGYAHRRSGSTSPACSIREHL